MMYGCRTCDFDLCARCINNPPGAPPRNMSLDDLPGGKKGKGSKEKSTDLAAGTAAVAAKVEARKAGVGSPGSPLDADAKTVERSQSRFEQAKTMTREMFAALNATPEERKLMNQVEVGSVRGGGATTTAAAAAATPALWGHAGFVACTFVDEAPQARGISC